MPPALQNPFTVWFVLSAALAALVYFTVRKELRVRATLYGAFFLACGVAIWPLHEKIKLGLDLKGGIHLVLQVVTDDALNATVDDAVQSARGQATAKGITFAGAQRVDTRSFSMDGVEPARVKDVRDLLRDYFRAPEWEVREPGEVRMMQREQPAVGLELFPCGVEVRRVEIAGNELAVRRDGFQQFE